MPKKSLEDKMQAAGGPVEMLRGQVTRYTNPEIPFEYTNWIEEQRACWETCALKDMSHHMIDIHIKGPEALSFLSEFSVNSFEGFKVGQAKLAVQCNTDGNIISQGLLMRVGEDDYIINGNPQVTHWLSYNLEKGDYDVTAQVLDNNDRMIHQIQGPESLKVLEKVTEDDFLDIGFMNFEEIDIGGITVRALRHGMAGEAGFELHAPARYSDKIWKTLLEAGEEHGIREYGWTLVNRIASGLAQGTDYIPAIYGDDMKEYREWLSADSYEATTSVAGSFDSNDITDYYRTPIELGWRSYVSFDHGFKGDGALKKEVEEPERTLVTLFWDDDDVLDVFASLFQEGEPHELFRLPANFHPRVRTDKVVKGDKSVGTSTSPGYIYDARSLLSLCTMEFQYSDPGTEVTIIWGEGGNPASPAVERHTSKKIQAEVAPAPYKEDKRKANYTTE